MNKYNRTVLLSLLLFSWSVVEAQSAIDLEIRAFDLIELNNGNQFEGTILAELTNLIQFETSAGKVSFKMSEVKSIRYRNPPEKVYQARRMGGTSMRHLRRPSLKSVSGAWIPVWDYWSKG